MTATRGFIQSIFLRRASLPIAILAMLILTSAATTSPAGASSDPTLQTLRGTVEGNGAVQPGYKVSLYASYPGGLPFDRALGTATTDGAGRFKIRYAAHPWLPYWLQPLLFVIAKDGPVMLASAIGSGPHHGDVVVNELTTVATATAFAQFVDGWKIRGNTYGMLNAVKVAEDMANPKTGARSDVLTNLPNGPSMGVYSVFDSLANAVAACVADDNNCYDLFAATTPTGGPAPKTVLQAIANATKYPSRPTGEDDPLFDVSLLNNTYQPALTERPTNWLLFIKFTGGFYSDYAASNLLNGPGQTAIDKQGNIWINDNYVPVDPTGDPTHPYDIACAGLRLLKFYPWGEPYAGMPLPTGYTGGGLSGAGFGITLDPKGLIWVGNFGFEAPLCADDPAVAAPHDSVSLFKPDGRHISRSTGFTKGHIWWPQATMSDRKGNIWAANCGNDTVTIIPKGNPGQARNFALPGGLGADHIFRPVYDKDKPDTTQPRLKPFGLTIDPKGRAWVTGNLAPGDPDSGLGAVYRVSSDGTIVQIPNTVTGGPNPGPLFTRPMGIIGDSEGNMWVSNSDAVNVPCVDPFERHKSVNPSVAFISRDGTTREVYTGGGLTVPWGSVMDGNGQPWVFNFNDHMDVDEDDFDYPLTAVSRFCGTGECPAGLSRGDPISPETGYMTDALVRVTGGAIGPSGLLVILNNWKLQRPRPAFYNTSPGGNSFVIVPGAAAPVKTPLIGPPQSFDMHHHLAFGGNLPYFLFR